jgi:hypothetical protein
MPPLISFRVFPCVPWAKTKIAQPDIFIARVYSLIANVELTPASFFPSIASQIRATVVFQEFNKVWRFQRIQNQPTQSCWWRG